MTFGREIPTVQSVSVILSVLALTGESRKATRPWRFLSNALLIEATVYPAVAMAGTKYCGLAPYYK